MALTPNSEKTREEKLAAKKAAEQDVLLREVDEAVRQDELGDLVNRYRWPFGIGLVLVLASFGGWLVWSDYREGQLEQRSETLITALDSLEAGRIEQADEALAELAESGSSAAAISSKLARAGIALRDSSRRAEAIELYESVAADAGAPQPYRDLAAIRAVAANFEQMDPQVVVDRLRPLATPGNPWFGSAGELVAMAYLKQGRENLAGPLFVEIAKDEDVPQTLRSRTRQMAGLLGYDAVEDVDRTLAEMREESEAAALPVPAGAQ